MLQAPMFDGLSFDLLPFDQDGLAAPEVDVGGCEIAEALVVAPMIVMGDEGVDLGLEVTGQVGVLEQDPVLEGLVPTLDLALGLGMVATRARGRQQDQLPAGHTIPPSDSGRQASKRSPCCHTESAVTYLFPTSVEQE